MFYIEQAKKNYEFRKKIFLHMIRLFPEHKVCSSNPPVVTNIFDPCISRA